MKLLWIGLGLSQEEKEEVLRNTGKLAFGYVSHSSLVEGLDIQGVDMDSINSYEDGILDWTRVPRLAWSRNGHSEDVTVSYRKILYLSILERTYTLSKEARRWAIAHREQEDVRVLVYSMHSPFMHAALEVKRIIPGAKVYLITPDLPQYMDLAMSRVKKILKWIDWQQIKLLNRKIDGFILYSKHMADFLGLEDDRWMLMEGSFDPSALKQQLPKQPKDTFAVMYSGVLDRRYGIPELLEAMKLLPENVELWFTGGGNAAEDIEAAAQADHRIKLFGFLPSRDELLEKQHEADCLISTRSPQEPGSAYCFPSKLFEYLISGNPVISTKILGIPEEYFDFLIPLESIDPEEIARCIRRVADMSPEVREKMGKEGRNFVLERKSNTAQCARILEFIK